MYFFILAEVREPWILKQFLNLAGNETIVRSQDYFTCLIYISRNRIGIHQSSLKLNTYFKLFKIYTYAEVLLKHPVNNST